MPLRQVSEICEGNVEEKVDENELMKPDWLKYVEGLTNVTDIDHFLKTNSMATNGNKAEEAAPFLEQITKVKGFIVAENNLGSWLISTPFRDCIDKRLGVAVSKINQ